MSSAFIVGNSPRCSLASHAAASAGVAGWRTARTQSKSPRRHTKANPTSSTAKKTPKSSIETSATERDEAGDEVDLSLRNPDFGAERPTSQTSFSAGTAAIPVADRSALCAIPHVPGPPCQTPRPAGKTMPPRPRKSETAAPHIEPQVELDRPRPHRRLAALVGFQLLRGRQTGRRNLPKRRDAKTNRNPTAANRAR